MKYALAAILFVLILSGCSPHLYKNYDFEPDSVMALGGTIGASLVGDWKKTSEIPEVTERGNPYYLSVYFDVDEAPGKDVIFHINNLNLSSGKVIYIDRIIKVKTSKQTAGKDGSHSGVGVENIVLPHKPVTVEGQVTYKGKVYDFSILLKNNYWEEYRINIIDQLMSV